MLDCLHGEMPAIRARIKNRKQVRQRLRQELAERLYDKMDIAGEQVGLHLSNTLGGSGEDNNGHIRAVWGNALAQLNAGPKTASQASQMRSLSKARTIPGMSSGVLTEPSGNRLKITARLMNFLPFASKVEHGGLLTPIAPHGYKAGGVGSEGELYSPRNPVEEVSTRSGGIRLTKGWLKLPDGTFVLKRQITNGLKTIKQTLSAVRAYFK